jgi:hypothetical protein
VGFITCGEEPEVGFITCGEEPEVGFNTYGELPEAGFKSMRSKECNRITMKAVIL